VRLWTAHLVAVSEVNRLQPLRLKQNSDLIQPPKSLVAFTVRCHCGIVEAITTPTPAAHGAHRDLAHINLDSNLPDKVVGAFLTTLLSAAFVTIGCGEPDSICARSGLPTCLRPASQP
jgi:hypothetical protein